MKLLITPVLLLQMLVASTLPLFVTTAAADHYACMGIIGVPAAADVVLWPFDSEYSWLAHRFPEAESWQSWRLHPGTDGGILFGTAQPPEALTAEFLMFNQPTTIYSTGNGVTIDSNEIINFDDLRRSIGNNVNDLGSGAGVDPTVPLVPDVTQLLAGENGWQINPDGSYHVIYNTMSGSNDIILHFYGNLLAVTASGDINGDGKVNVADILLAERHVFQSVPLTAGQVARGDLAPAGNGDGVLTIADIYLIFSLIQQ